MAVKFNIFLFVEFKAEELEAVADVMTKFVGIFADSSGENDSVQTAHDSGISTDVTLDLITEHFNSGFCLTVAF